MEDEISPDIEQWLIQDTQVVSKWRLLARHLEVDEFLHDEEFGRGRRGRRVGGENYKMERMLRVWKKKYPDSYNITTLKGILLAEGLYDMWMWINIITKDRTRSCSGISTSSASPFSLSPWGRYLYSLSPRHSSSLSSPSSYTNSDYACSLSGGGSRPPSQLSDCKANISISPTTTPNTIITTTSNSSLLCRPDLIQMSSPRHWIRHCYQGRSKHSSTKSAGLSVLGDRLYATGFREDNHDDFSGNDDTGKNTKQSETSENYGSMIVDQSPAFDSENISESNFSKEKIGTTERIYNKNDKDVIKRVNKMNADIQIEVMKSNSREKLQENIKKNVQFECDGKHSYETQFDIILGLIQQAVVELDV